MCRDYHSIPLPNFGKSNKCGGRVRIFSWCRDVTKGIIIKIIQEQNENLHKKHLKFTVIKRAYLKYIQKRFYIILIND